MFKKIIVATGFLMGASLLTGVANAQMMGYGYPATSTITNGSSTLTAVQAQGQTIYQQLQAKQISCSNISDSNYEALGEYYIGVMAGPSFQSMDNAMDQTVGQNTSQAMYTAAGKRLSGCDPNAALPTGTWSSMMQGGWSSPWNNNYGNIPMMNYGYGYGGGSIFGFLWMILWWAIVVVVIVAVVRRLSRGSHHGGWQGQNNSALDILKERYAKGEIDKKEFDERKKDL